MARKPHNVRIIRYFFPESYVKAHEDHDPSGPRNGTRTDLDIAARELPTEELQHGVELTLESIDDESDNAPYSFKVVAYGIFEPDSKDTEDLINDYKNNVQLVALQILAGAAREHLAAITARAPWSTFIAASINVDFKNEESRPQEK